MRVGFTVLQLPVIELRTIMNPFLGSVKVPTFFHYCFWVAFGALRSAEDHFIVPTFDTKVTEYFCSGWVFFFFRQISTF